MAILPPQVSAETFAEAIRKFRAVVGTEWVFTADEDVRLYRDSYSPSVGRGRREAGLGRRRTDFGR